MSRLPQLVQGGMHTATPGAASGRKPPVCLTDAELNYDNLESEHLDAARDRRISLLSTQLEFLARGVAVERDAPQVCEGVDDVSCTLLNPGELHQLVTLSRFDHTPPSPVFRERDITADLELPQARQIDEDISFLRFVLIATKPHLLHWWQQTRTPLTDDDLAPVYATDLDDDSTVHAWSNALQADRIERAYVENWMQERQLRRLAQLERAALGTVRPHPGPVTDDEAARYGQVHELRRGLRANAAPLPAYDIRLEADLIGDLQFAAGGGKTSGSSGTIGHQPSRDSTTRTGHEDSFIKAVLTYHGSFAPFHTGHRECITRALQFLAINNVYVEKAVIGFTAAAQVSRKNSDVAFADVALRYQIAKIVIDSGDRPVSPISIDQREHTASLGRRWHWPTRMQSQGLSRSTSLGPMCKSVRAVKRSL
eukprot:1487433-Amphidinium_carterae.1